MYLHTYLHASLMPLTASTICSTVIKSPTLLCGNFAIFDEFDFPLIAGVAHYDHYSGFWSTLCSCWWNVRRPAAHKLLQEILN